MTPTVTPTAGALPQYAAAPPQPASVDLHGVLARGSTLGGTSAFSSIPEIVPPSSGSSVAGASSTATAVGGGPQAAQGAAAVTAAQPQLASAIQQVVSALQALIGALQGGAAGAASMGGGGSGAHCAMPGCGHGAPAPGAAQGAAGAPRAGRSSRADSSAPLRQSAVTPGSVKDKASTAGLSPTAMRGLQEAHKHGLPLVSGKRGGNPSSDHFHGNAIDVGTLPIGSPSSTQGTPEMVAYAEHMRQAGRAGQLGVKYVILDGRIASPTNNWEWRPYTYPGKSAGELAALKSSNRGAYNRLQHYDHVHVSFR